jgi:hypothetical protein
LAAAPLADAQVVSSLGESGMNDGAVERPNCRLRRGEPMRVMGMLATAVIVVVTSVVVGLSATCLPDIKRYVRISRM